MCFLCFQWRCLHQYFPLRFDKRMFRISAFLSHKMSSENAWPWLTNYLILTLISATFLVTTKYSYTITFNLFNLFASKFSEIWSYLNQFRYNSWKCCVFTTHSHFEKHGVKNMVPLDDIIGNTGIICFVHIYCIPTFQLKIRKQVIMIP